jgi:hypothetical protein
MGGEGAYSECGGFGLSSGVGVQMNGCEYRLNAFSPSQTVTIVYPAGKAIESPDLEDL